MKKMSGTVTIPRTEYEELRKKANQLDGLVRDEQLTPAELRRTRGAMKGPFLTERAFLERNPDLR